MLLFQSDVFLIHVHEFSKNIENFAGLMYIILTPNNRVFLEKLIFSKIICPYFT